MGQKHIPIDIHRLTARLEQLKLKVPIHIRQRNVHLRVSEVDAKTRAGAATKRDEIAREFPPVWRDGVVEPALGLEGERIGEDRFVVRD